MGKNYLTIQKGLHSLLLGLAPYVARELKMEFGDNWWQEAVIDKLWEDQKFNLPTSGDWSSLVDSLDIQCCLRLFDIHWQQVFRRKLSVDHRTWAKELSRLRNKVSHIGGQDFSDNDTWRALDTMFRLCEQIDPEGTAEIGELLREFRYGSAAGSMHNAEGNQSAGQEKAKGAGTGVLAENIQGLPSWRDVIEPHPDVAQGRYRNAEFAANLAQVARGEGSFEYRDPVEFFARTYVTEGMAGLLVQALKRVAGRDGEPVIQLKTAFGGGKTHSMLALYHMMRGGVPLAKVPNLQPVLAQAGLHSLPKANVAVLVGTDLDPNKGKRPQNFAGNTVNTLWGEMAYQLAISAGKPEIYSYVKDGDKRGVSPGAEAIKNLFNACAPCLVLMDELVAYARKIYGAVGLPAGSFDNFITFIQEVTEAACASQNSLVVASIPESDIEIGGEGGQKVLEAIEHTFGRMEAIWKPVTANEGFEVVRRRLFLPCKNEEGRDLVCARFSQMYNANPADFPVTAKEVDYRDRMLACYPIHPEIFDRLYEDWATLEDFQRTRGVLRLMAAVIHELWMGNDAGAMIMPGSVQLNMSSVRNELTRYLPESWNAIVDREVDGTNSLPYKIDKDKSRYGKKLAARRVARTIMLGSAPTVRGQAVRGIKKANIRLGVVQPGENIAEFNDALSALQDNAAYLYTDSSGERYWYDTRPTLRKTMEDRMQQVAASEVEYEIEKRLKKLRKESHFAGLHVCPNSSLDVTDEQAVRLVLLRQEATHKGVGEVRESLAVAEAEDILSKRGNTPRIYQNMLAFVAADKDVISSVQQEARRYLAWQSIQDDSEALNLDAAQNRETKQSLKRSDETVELRLKEAYCWLLVPYIDRNADIKAVQWDIVHIRGGDEGIVAKVANKMQQNDLLIRQWAPALLLMELDDLLWKETDSIQIKKLWEYLCTYCYLPRLASYEVLENAIRRGLASDEYFALAAGKSNGRFLELQCQQQVSVIEQSALLVKMPVALKQIEEERSKKPSMGVAKDRNGGYGNEGNGGGDVIFVKENEPEQPEPPVPTPQQPKNIRFFMSAKLDNMRINRDVHRLVEEIISHLTDVDGSRVEVCLEVEAAMPDGVPQSTMRTVNENCQTLRIDNFGFEEQD